MEKRLSKKKGLVISSGAMVLVAAAALTTSSFAWFTDSLSASISDVDLNIAASNALLISAKSNEGFRTSLDASELKAIDTNFLNDNGKENTDLVTYNMRPVTPKVITATKPALGTGDSALKFQVPTNDPNEIDTVWAYDDVTGALEGTAAAQAQVQNYSSFDVYFMSSFGANQTITVSLDLTSTVDTPTPGTYVGTSVTPLTSDKKIAIKPGETPSGATEEASNAYYNTYAVRYGFVVSKAVEASGDPVVSPTYTVKTFEPNNSADCPFVDVPVDSTNKAYTCDAASSENGKAAADLELFAGMAANEVWKVTVFVWLEGNDVDCGNSISLSSFRTKLVFKGATVAA